MMAAVHTRTLAMRSGSQDETSLKAREALPSGTELAEQLNDEVKKQYIKGRHCDCSSLWACRADPLAR